MVFMVGKVEVNDVVKMSTAISSSRNETNWSKITSNNNLIGKFPFSDPNPNPNQDNSNPNHHNFSSRKKSAQYSSQINNGVVEESIPSDAASFSHNHHRDDIVGVEHSFSHYVKYDLSGFSNAELCNLKSQFVYELDKVRNLLSRIESVNVSNRNVSKKRPSPFSPNNGNNSRNPDPKRFEPQQARYVASPPIMKMCGTVLRKLSNQKAGIWFNSPVDAVGMGLHDYHTVINHPMDLGTIKGKLDRRFYDTPDEFAADVRLTFNNALRYNPKGHEVNTFAGQYLALFERWFPPILSRFEGEKQLYFQQVGPLRIPASMSVPVIEDVPMVEIEADSILPSPEPLKVTPPPVSVPELVEREAPVVIERRGRPSEGKLPKPKAKEPNKREMSVDEKRKLGDDLQVLPEEKMMQVIQIIRKRNGDLTQDGDEIELDMEAVDTETLWELDRFVGNYKKMVSKIRRQGLLTPNDNAAHSDETNQVEMGEINAEVLSKEKVGGVVGGDVGDDDVDIGGDEMPPNIFPPVEIDKDNDSSGSSSSDDSSSSDSDSGSSSGSDSDVDDAQSCDKESENFHRCPN